LFQAGTGGAKKKPETGTARPRARTNRLALLQTGPRLPAFTGKSAVRAGYEREEAVTMPDSGWESGTDSTSWFRIGRLLHRKNCPSWL